MKKSEFDYPKLMPYLFGDKKANVAYSPAGVPYNAKVPIFNRKMQIVIPTHNRPTKQITLKSLRAELQKEVLVVTSTRADRDAIRTEYASIIRPEQVYAINNPKIDSIAKKRQWLIENLGSTSVFQIDDDCYFFARCPTKFRFVSYETSSSGAWELKPEYKGKTHKGAEIKLLGVANLSDAMLVDAFRQLQDRMTRKEDRYVHVGMSSRMGNNQESDEWKIIGRAMHLIGHRRDALIHNNIRFDEIKLREDFNVTLRLLQLGLPNTIYYTVCGSPSDYGAKGGCSDERTEELANQQAELLGSKFPGFVKVLNKKYSHSGDRKEVYIYWDKVYKAALAKKAQNAKSSLF